MARRAALPRRTVRLRLTALYGGLFLASGAGLLAITNILARSWPWPTARHRDSRWQPASGASAGHARAPCALPLPSCKLGRSRACGRAEPAAG